MVTFLHVGGCIAAGFDPTLGYLLTISHDGRGVFCTKSWKRIARDYDLAYPKDGIGIGIGPIQQQAITVTEIDYATGSLSLASPDGQIQLRYSEGAIEVTDLRAI